MRARIERGTHEPRSFRAALLEVEPTSRDEWLDVVLGLREIPDDGDDLPRDCVPYLPCAVDVLVRVVDHAAVRADDVFVDLGAGVGRAPPGGPQRSGAAAIGVEIQRGLVAESRRLSRRLPGLRLSTIEGDAAKVAGHLALGTVFFLYCPFGGARLAATLASLEPIARTRMLRVCAVDVPLPPLDWLAPEPQISSDLTIHRTTLHDEALTEAIGRNFRSLAGLAARPPAGVLGTS